MESTRLVVNDTYSIRQAATVVGAGHSTIGKWVRQLPQEHEAITPKQSAMAPEDQRINDAREMATARR